MLRLFERLLIDRNGQELGGLHEIHRWLADGPNIFSQNRSYISGMLLAHRHFLNSATFVRAGHLSFAQCFNVFLSNVAYKWNIRSRAQLTRGIRMILFMAEKAANMRLSTFWVIPNTPHPISSSGFCAQKLKTGSRRFEHSRFRHSSFIV
jgi:hypothetical protein